MASAMEGGVVPQAAQPKVIMYAKRGRLGRLGLYKLALSFLFYIPTANMAPRKRARAAASAAAATPKLTLSGRAAPLGGRLALARRSLHRHRRLRRGRRVQGAPHRAGLQLRVLS